ncbi:hypothetical protein NDU88_005399 [Pleurodeles waltl]|uniref:Uncharacterized protein n=1 Tax=Pleurodeles waltl TaxID=8319 RepID=A0AAV7MAE3_PLEWA|nr:hypothetical protein NDU88_005399 [Pleurodeles waltl]
MNGEIRGTRGASDPSTGDRLWHQREVPETDPSPQTDPGRQRLTPATGHQREALETDPSPETDPGHRASETDPGHQRLTSRHHNLTSGTRERPQRLTPGTRERDRVPETDPEHPRQHPRQDPHQRLTPGTIPRAPYPGRKRQTPGTGDNQPRTPAGHRAAGSDRRRRCRLPAKTRWEDYNTQNPLGFLCAKWRESAVTPPGPLNCNKVPGTAAAPGKGRALCGPLRPEETGLGTGLCLNCKLAVLHLDYAVLCFVLLNHSWWYLLQPTYDG